MKTSVILFGILLLFAMAVTSYAQVTVNGNAIQVNGQRYDIRGVCYSPRAIGSNWTDYPDLGFPSYQPFRDDLAMMQQACINTIRTYYAIFDQQRLDEIHAAGMKVIITLPYWDGRENVEWAHRYSMTDNSYRNYINLYKNHPAILMWSFGNEVNYHEDNNTWYAALEAAAQWVHANDPNHPVTTANGELPSANVINTLCPSVDVWGVNIYRQLEWFGAAIGEFSEMSSKPFFFSEFGVDVYNHLINGEDQASQSTGILSVIQNLSWSMQTNGAASGGCIFEWSDEWHKAGNNSSHETGGFAPAGDFYPDGISDEEYYGIVDVYRNPRQVFNDLKDLWGAICREGQPATFVLEDAECYQHLDYWLNDGPLSIVPNPSANTTNNSEKCYHYSRAKTQYAAIIGQMPRVTDVSDYVSNYKSVLMDVYSNAPGTVVTLNFENHLQAQGTWPKGRHSSYTAVTNKTNEWETLKFTFAEYPGLDLGGSGTSSDEIDQLAILFAPGETTNSNTYYFDNIKGPEVLTTADVGISSMLLPGDPVACYATNQTIRVNLHNYDNRTIDFAERPVDITVQFTGPSSASFSQQVSSGILQPGTDLAVSVTTSANLSALGTYQLHAYTQTGGDVNCINNAMTPVDIVSDACAGSIHQIGATNQDLFIVGKTIHYRSSQTDDIELDLFDLTGHYVAAIYSGKIGPGTGTYKIDCPACSNGIYLVKVTGQSGHLVKKITLRGL